MYWLKILLIIILIFFITSSIIIERELFDFFIPDDNTYETLQLPFNLGLRLIKQIKKLEEVFIAFPFNDNMTFIDIGFDAYVSKSYASAKFDLEKLLSYLVENKITGIVYFIHNHPRDKTSSPSFGDYLCVSNLKKEIRDRKINVDIVSLVISKKGIWKYDTTDKFEKGVVDDLRDELYLHLAIFKWAHVARQYEKDIEMLIKEMNKRNVILEHYKSCSKFIKSLK